MEVVAREVRKKLLQKVPSHKDERVKKAKKFIESQIEQFIEQVVIPLGNDFDFEKLEVCWNIYKEGVDVRRVPPFTPSSENVQEIMDFFEGREIQDYFDLGYSFLSDCYSAISNHNRNKLKKERLTTVFNSDDPVDWVRNFKETKLEDSHLKLLENIGILLQLKI